MRNLLLLAVAALLTSCGALTQLQEQQLAYLSSPEGRLQAQRQFTLDSIRASNNNYYYGYYDGFRIDYRRGFSHYYDRFGRKVIVRHNGYGGTRVTVGRPQRGFKYRPARTPKRRYVKPAPRTRTRVAPTRVPKTRVNTAPRGRRNASKGDKQ